MKNLGVLTFLIFLASGVQAQDTTPPPSDSAGESEAYVPGLGDMMGAIQVRHAKLWFAGTAKNWPLAAYEVDEIKEALDAAAIYQPEFKGRPVAAMIDTVAIKPLAQVASAIAAKDPVRFKKAFDELTAACNSCHQGVGYAFILIKRPSVPPVTNQRFNE
jgi:hypothetical protein